MSREALEHLNTQTLIGFTEKRGMAWHYRADQQSEKPNHYPAAIPVADVGQRLFNWHAVSRRLAVEVPSGPDVMTHLAEDGAPQRWAVVAGKQAISRSDDTSGAVMNRFHDVWMII